MAENNRSSNLGAFLIGALVGAAVVAFAKTDQGRAVVEKVKREGLKTAKDVLDQLRELEAAAGEEVEEQVEQIVESDQPQVLTTNLADDQITAEEASQAKDDVAKHIAELQNRGRLLGRKFFKKH